MFVAVLRFLELREQFRSSCFLSWKVYFLFLHSCILFVFCFRVSANLSTYSVMPGGADPRETSTENRNIEIADRLDSMNVDVDHGNVGNEEPKSDHTIVFSEPSSSSAGLTPSSDRELLLCGSQLEQNSQDAFPSQSSTNLANGEPESEEPRSDQTMDFSPSEPPSSCGVVPSSVPASLLCGSLLEENSRDAFPSQTQSFEPEPAEAPVPIPQPKLTLKISRSLPLVSSPAPEILNDAGSTSGATLSDNQSSVTGTSSTTGATTTSSDMDTDEDMLPKLSIATDEVPKPRNHTFINKPFRAPRSTKKSGKSAPMLSDDEEQSVVEKGIEIGGFISGRDEAAGSEPIVLHSRRPARQAAINNPLIGVKVIHLPPAPEEEETTSPPKRVKKETKKKLPVDDARAKLKKVQAAIASSPPKVDRSRGKQTAISRLSSKLGLARRP